ncbi:MAG: M23 family metallopeptidase [Ignavibacteriae bacterium]|nr:M23 family metallopeptidase [Ignavibacteriota bacterium]
MHGKIIYLFFTIILLSGCSSKIEDIYQKNLEGPIAAGCPGVTYPNWKTSEYVLPFPIGKSYKVDLSNCSGSFHGKGEPDQFAVDFNMKIGSLITASRKGKVVHVVESGKDGEHPNNLIVIDHGDSTFAQYMHLTRKGSYVEVGDSVEQGDKIGLSGSTGLAGYPHLHFVVTKSSWEWPYESIPITFKNTLSNERGLFSGTLYEAFEY